MLDLSSNSTVIASGTQAQNFQPPVGRSWELLNWFFYSPGVAGSSSGTHKMSIYRGTVSTAYELTYGESNYNVAITLGRNAQYTATTEQPSTAADQKDLLFGGVRLIATNDNYLVFNYANDTDVSMSANRALLVFYREW